MDRTIHHSLNVSRSEVARVEGRRESEGMSIQFNSGDGTRREDFSAFRRAFDFSRKDSSGLYEVDSMH